MLLVLKIVFVVFAAVMIFFPKKIWDIFYGNFSENAEMPCLWHIVRLVL